MSLAKRLGLEHELGVFVRLVCRWCKREQYWFVPCDGVYRTIQCACGAWHELPAQTGPG